MKLPTPQLLAMLLIMLALCPIAGHAQLASYDDPHGKPGVHQCRPARSAAQPYEG